MMDLFSEYGVNVLRFRYIYSCHQFGIGNFQVILEMMNCFGSIDCQNVYCVVFHQYEIMIVKDFQVSVHSGS